MKLVGLTVTGRADYPPICAGIGSMPITTLAVHI
jgi:hypothetical protein